MPGRWVTRHAADAVTALRIALTPLFLLSVWGPASGAARWPSGLLFALIAGSDFADGRIARRCGVASARGRLLDHGADIAFVLGALGVYRMMGVVPWWVPAAIAASFGAYAADAWRGGDGHARLIGSRIGHAGGVLNYALIGVLVGNHTIGLHWLPPALMTTLFWCVPIYSAAAVASRVGERLLREAVPRPGAAGERVRLERRA